MVKRLNSHILNSSFYQVKFTHSPSVTYKLMCLNPIYSQSNFLKTRITSR